MRFDDNRNFTAQFTAMASPCAVIVDCADVDLCNRLAAVVRGEAERIEAKFSRYRPSVVTSINQSAGSRVEVDAETADLLDYATECYELSGHRFDITSGALRRVWRFDGSRPFPAADEIAEVMQVVGWHRVWWERPYLTLGPGMEIDFGGIGKEYAVDRALALAQDEFDVPALVNFGGDLRVSGARADGGAWRVAIEDVDTDGKPSGFLDLSRGALATSGDAHRFILHDGRRFGHVLDPLTGWPVSGAPRSVTVHADSCSEAGLLAKLSLMSGAHAEEFLKSERVRAWVTR
jgi:FAD:protein FMN transferase